MASAINAGCRVACGDVIFLLDADDLLYPDAVETVLAQWRSGTVMTQSRLAMADAEGRRVDGTTPPWEVPLAEGDVRAAMLSNGSYSVTLTSGLALHRQALLAVLPIPEDHFRAAADGYLVRAMPFQGLIQAVDRPLALYRRHGNSESGFGDATTSMGIALRKRIGFIRNELNALEAIAAKHGFEVPPNLCERNPDYLFARLSSLVTDPQNHPVSGDTRWRLWPRVISIRLERALPAWTPAVGRPGRGVGGCRTALPARAPARGLVVRARDPSRVASARLVAPRHGGERHARAERGALIDGFLCGSAGSRRRASRAGARRKRAPPVDAAPRRSRRLLPALRVRGRGRGGDGGGSRRGRRPGVARVLPPHLQARACGDGVAAARAGVLDRALHGAARPGLRALLSGLQQPLRAVRAQKPPGLARSLPRGRLLRERALGAAPARLPARVARGVRPRLPGSPPPGGRGGPHGRAPLQLPSAGGRCPPVLARSPTSRHA